MAKAVFKVVKPPVVLKALPSASSRKVLSAPHQPEDGGPKLEASKPGESTPSISQPSQLVLEQISGVPTLTQVRLMSPPQRGNSLLEVSKSNFPLDS